MPRPTTYHSIRETAQTLKLSPQQIRNYVKAKKVRTTTHPKTGWLAIAHGEFKRFVKWYNS